ncbi:radical SAM protein [Fundidesulfovibrio butyratiphilus]
MKVLFANPPWKKAEGRFGVRAGSRWPFTMPTRDETTLPYIPFPFFLAYAAALAEERSDAEVLAVDAIAEGLTVQAYRKRVEDFAPDVLIAETALASFDHDLAHARAAKAALPGVVSVLAGPQASVDPAALLAKHPEADFCLVGEYEWTALELIEGLSRPGFDPSAVAGLAWRDASGSPRVNARRALGDLADLPWPAYRHFPMTRYKDYFCGISGLMVNMVASRGCPHRCSFCLWPEVMYGGHAYRVRDPRDVADEMAHLVATYGFKTVYFDDDTFNIGKRRVLALAEEIRLRGIEADLAVMARADSMDGEMLDALRAAGLVAVKYGVESASPDILARCGKGLDLEAAKRTIRHTRSLGVKTHLTFTLGLPGETVRTMGDSLRLALELDPDSLQVSLATPFPGTPFHAFAVANGFLEADRVDLFDGSNRATVRTEALTSRELEQGLRVFQETWKAHRQAKERTRAGG